MITALDTRYKDRLKDVSAFLGEENFVLWMSRWSIEYVNMMFNLNVPHYNDELELFRRVDEYEKITKHQMTALLKVLAEDHPDIKFHWGLTSEDIMHNARWSQASQVISVIYSELERVEVAIEDLADSMGSDILAHTHGQPATPVDCYKYLRGKYALGVGFDFPSFRMGGSNGQLTAWRALFPHLSSEDCAHVWLKAVRTKFFIDKESPICIETPNEFIGLLQHGPSNSECILSCIGSALHLRALARALWDHCYRGVLVVKTEENQTGSSAMPHKVNPLDFEQAEGAFSNAYHIFLGTLEANADSRGLRDLSNSIVNRSLPDAFAYIFLGVSALVRGANNSHYSMTKVTSELEQHPECLSELVRYCRVEKRGELDETVYKDLKNNPPTDFRRTIEELKNEGFNIDVTINNNREN